MAKKIRLFNGNAVSKAVTITILGCTPADFDAAVRRVGNLPSNVISSSQLKSAKYVARMASALAPRHTHALAENIVVSKKERARKRWKAGYDIWINPAKNSTFQKFYRAAGTGERKQAYYPASMEYGFTRTTTRGRQYSYPGIHYIKAGAQATEPYHQQITIDYIVRYLDKCWAKQNGGSV